MAVSRAQRLGISKAIATRETGDMNPSASMLEDARTSRYAEIGTSGLRQFGGYVLEEWLTQLQGRRAAWVYREMMDNSPVVGAILFAIESLARGVNYRVEKGNDQKAADFVEDCMNDMSTSWQDTITECLSCLPYGWSFHELVYKQRNGYQAEPMFDGDKTVGLPPDMQENDSNPATSQFKDGKIGWRKIPARAQETLLRWIFDGYSGLAAMEQIDWHGGNHTIPVQKALLFRNRPRRNNPEGYSILRTSYVPYFMLKNIQQIEAIGIERDLAGLPVLAPPPGVDIFSQGQEDLLNLAKALVTGVKRDENSGIILPTTEWEFNLVSAGGSRQIDTDEVIRRYEQRIATSVLADFVLVGQDAVGSYAMVDIKSDLFGVALDCILDSICDVFNNYAIPRLLKMNGMDVSDPPRITHGSAGRIALDKVGTFLQSLALAGAPIPWSVELLRSLFLNAGLPADFEEHAKPETLPTVDPKPDPMLQPVGTGTDAAAMKTRVQEPKGSTTTAQAATQQVAKAQLPPHLRRSDDPARECETCIFMGADGYCSKFDWPVERDDVCDDWAPDSKVSKADRGAAKGGQVVHVGPHLRHRAGLLSEQLDGEILGAFAELGDHSAAAYQTLVNKAKLPNIKRIVSKVMQVLDIKAWIEHRLMPILVNHAGRVTADTVRTLNTEIGLEVSIGDQQAQQIAAQAGVHLNMSDIDEQVRDTIARAIEDGFAAGENPTVTARRIRELVPAGRFREAGSKYRSQLIARNETANLQREASLAAYRSNDNIVAVRLQDGIYGPPRSDGACMARDGEQVPIEAAGGVAPYHPNCTLGFEPVVRGGVRKPDLVRA